MKLQLPFDLPSVSMPSLGATRSALLGIAGATDCCFVTRKDPRLSHAKASGLDVICAASAVRWPAANAPDAS